MIKLILLFILSSCSAFINQLDENILTQEKEFYYGNKKQLTCENKSKLEIINSNINSQKVFANALKGPLKAYKFTFIEKLVLWSFYQFNLRPDIHSPSAKLQIIVNYGNDDKYFHFFSKEIDAYPTLYGLEYLLNTYKSRYSLITIAKIVDDFFKNTYTVSKGFETFLNKNSQALITKSPFRSRFFRGDETLKENENIVPESLLKIVKLYNRTKNKKTYQVSTKLFEYESNNLVSRCNYDMTMYNNSIYLIHKDFIKSHLFGLKDRNSYFLASSSQDFSAIESIAGTHFIKGRSLSRSAAFCKFDFKAGQEIWLSSTKSRDPGQHLYHLIEYGINGVESMKELEQIMRFSRHLFLENPHRLIIESKRSSKEQLNRILKIDIPIYNATSLGKIWGHFSSKSNQGFIIDDRESGNILCK